MKYRLFVQNINAFRYNNQYSTLVIHAPPYKIPYRIQLARLPLKFKENENCLYNTKMNQLLWNHIACAVDIWEYKT